VQGPDGRGLAFVVSHPSIIQPSDEDLSLCPGGTLPETLDGWGTRFHLPDEPLFK